MLKTFVLVLTMEYQAAPSIRYVIDYNLSGPDCIAALEVNSAHYLGAGILACEIDIGQGEGME